MRITQECTAPPGAVWKVWTDLDRFAEVADVIAVERLDDGQEFTVGTRWRETRRVFGREATEEMWVTAVSPGDSYVVEAESHGSRYHSVLSVEESATGSVLSMDFTATGTNPLASLMGKTVGRLFEGATRSMMQRDLAAVAAAAEADQAATDGRD